MSLTAVLAPAACGLQPSAEEPGSGTERLPAVRRVDTMLSIIMHFQFFKVSRGKIDVFWGVPGFYLFKMVM